VQLLDAALAELGDGTEERHLGGAERARAAKSVQEGRDRRRGRAGSRDETPSRTKGLGVDVVVDQLDLRTGEGRSRQVQRAPAAPQRPLEVLGVPRIGGVADEGEIALGDRRLVGGRDEERLAGELGDAAFPVARVVEVDVPAGKPSSSRRRRISRATIDIAPKKATLIPFPRSARMIA